ISPPRISTSLPPNRATEQFISLGNSRQSIYLRDMVCPLRAAAMLPAAHEESTRDLAGAVPDGASHRAGDPGKIISSRGLRRRGARTRAW
uniref:hypothetical protein n=1 Tax=Bordetella pertussis TaxID=520 RepID=UPI00366BF5AB